MENRALGKGLSALIPEKADIQNEAGVPSDPVTYVKTDRIRDNSFQPRTKYDDKGIAELAASIKEKGILQPILVREMEGGYEVIAGERRLKAARSIPLAEIPVIIKKVTDQEALVLALVENIQREELNPIEEAKAYRRLIEDFRFYHEDVAKAVGKDRATITNTLRLLKLPEEIQASVFDGELSMGHARALLSIENPEEQRRAFARVIQKKLSVREVENLVKISTLASGQVKRKKEPSHDLVFLEEDLQQVLGTKVKIQARRKRGKLIIEYYSPDDLERIIQIIKK